MTKLVVTAGPTTYTEPESFFGRDIWNKWPGAGLELIIVIYFVIDWLVFLFFFSVFCLFVYFLAIGFNYFFTLKQMEDILFGFTN